MSSQRNAGIVGNLTHAFTPLFHFGKSLAPSQRVSPGGPTGLPTRQAPLGPSGFGTNLTAPPMNLSSPPVLTPAVHAGILATRSGTFHV